MKITLVITLFLLLASCADSGASRSYLISESETDTVSAEMR